MARLPARARTARRFPARDLFRRLAEADSVAVIGLGRFGTALATELVASGTHVLGIDSSESIVESLDGVLTQVVRADSTNETALRQLAVPEFSHVVVAIGSDIESSILTSSLLLRLGIGDIWAKATTDAHGAILGQLGVRHVVFPERDMGRRVAHLVRGDLSDFVELGDGQALVVATATAETLRATTTRGTVLILAVRETDGWNPVSAERPIRIGDTLLVLGPTRDAEAFWRAG